MFRSGLFGWGVSEMTLRRRYVFIPELLSPFGDRRNPEAAYLIQLNEYLYFDMKELRALVSGPRFWFHGVS